MACEKRGIARIAMFVLGMALALPVAMTLTHDVASASGYIVATGITGEPVCNPGGSQDCPN